MTNSFAQFWDAVNRTFALARSGNEQKAREQIRISLQAWQASLTAAVARQLVDNNEGEEAAALQIGQIYDRVQRQVYLFLTAILITILLTSLYLIRSRTAVFLHSLTHCRTSAASSPRN
ncbi:MAG: hypothetical protein ACYDCD_02375 [Candidatus Acidiferrales bacterium]